MFDDQVINCWIVVYHSSLDCEYLYYSWDDVRLSLSSSLETYFDGGFVDINKILDCLEFLKPKKCISISVNDFSVIIRRLTFSKHDKIHRLFESCYNHVPDQIKLQILGLFNNEVI